MDILAVIQESVKEIFSEVVNAEPVCVASLESEVLRASRELGRKVLEARLSESGEQACGPVVCPACAGESRRLRRRRCYIETLCGVVRVSRWVYRCECGHVHVPWDAAEGLKAGGYTPGVAQAMCRLSGRLDFREAAEELKNQGISVSHTTLQQKVQEWSLGEKVSDYVDEQSLEVGSRWYVSCDGCHTPSGEGWQAVKVGCVYRDYPQLGPGSIPSARAASLRYVASRSTAAVFGSQWFELATASGLYKDETAPEEVVVIGDGAAWIWNLSKEYFPGAVEIVDYMHAKSHLYNVAKQTYGETSEVAGAVERWVERTDAFLRAGDIQEVIARIRALGVGNASLSEVLETEVGYFQKHAKRMRYKMFAEKGYHIASGVIESACKHVVAQRCKQASMKWSTPGINAVLFWRCLLKSQAWQAFWRKNSKAA